MKRFSFRPAFAVRGRDFFGLRGWNGAPTHPMLVHFPIAAYVIAAALYVVAQIAGPAGWGRDAFVAATWVLTAGLLVSLLTALTGVLDWMTIMPGSQVRRTANAHGLVMVVATVLAVVDVALAYGAYRGGTPGAAVLVLTIVVAALVTAGSGLGGALVYDYGFRVVNSTSSPEWEPSEVDIMPDGSRVPAGGGRREPAS